jgi:hypothetical protein
VKTAASGLFCFSDAHYLKTEGEDKKNSLISDAPKDLENGVSGTKQADKAEAGTAEYLIQLEERRSIKVSVHPSNTHPYSWINTDDLI